MNGFEAYIPAATTLKRLDPPNSLLKVPQKGGGAARNKTSVTVVSPTEQVLEQAKESLKRNKEEVKNLGGSPSVPVKKVKTSPTDKKSGNKSQKIHNKYGRGKGKGKK